MKFFVVILLAFAVISSGGLNDLRKVANDPISSLGLKSSSASAGGSPGLNVIVERLPEGMAPGMESLNMVITGMVFVKASDHVKEIAPQTMVFSCGNKNGSKLFSKTITSVEETVEIKTTVNKARKIRKCILISHKTGRVIARSGKLRP